MFKEALELIKKYDRIIIHRHSYPDGDAMGSQIGLKAILKENFPNKEIYAVGDRSTRFSFMEQSEPDILTDDMYNGALAVVLDTSAVSLISDNRYEKAAATLRFDHHIFVQKICDVEVLDTTFESCCGLIACFAKEENLKLNPLAAKSLYTGMVTDSGRFRYDSTSSKTFALASYLTEQQFSLNDIYTNLYADEYENICRRASFILKIKFTKNQVAYIYTTKSEVKELDIDTFSISRGMVNTMSDIRGVDIWVNFTEAESGVLCEIRSSKYNINPIAVKYGGGGHAKASGATVSDYDKAMQLLNDLDNLAGGIA